MEWKVTIGERVEVATSLEALRTIIQSVQPGERYEVTLDEDTAQAMANRSVMPTRPRPA